MSTTKSDYRRYHDCATTTKEKPIGPFIDGYDWRKVESLSKSVDRLHWEKHAQYRRWQDAVTMNMVFGDDYVTTPPIPKGYEKLAQQWHDDLKPVR